MKSSTLVVSCALALLGAATGACGSDDSKVACEGKAAGDECAYGNIPTGFCEQDADDEVLECEHTITLDPETGMPSISGGAGGEGTPGTSGGGGMGGA